MTRVKCILIFNFQVFIFYPCLIKETAAAENKVRDRGPGSDQVIHTERVLPQLQDFALNEQPFRTPDEIRKESIAAIPPPKTLPKNSPRHHYKPTWESLESRPIPEWYEDAKV